MLTDIALRALKPADKPYKKSDGGGLFILVQCDGKKFWRLSYRFGGKQKLLSGGRYPRVGLKAARTWRDAAKQQLARGLDPSAERKADKELLRAPVSNGFEDVAREWLETRTLGWSPRYAALVVGRLEADVFPFIGKTEISAITPRTILEVIRRIEARGAVEMAHRVKNHVSEIFRFAIPDGRCESDPCRDLSAAMTKPKPVQHRPKVSARELPEFFQRLGTDGGSRLSHLALRWTMVTMVRSQETRFAEWSEFEDLDGAEPLWRIPPERMKMRSEHLVPLSHQAVTLLREIHGLNIFRKAGNMRLGRFLFPVAGAQSLVISENRMHHIMYRLGLRGKATVHGFRGLASTVLNETGLFKDDWIEHQLAHQPRGVRAAYNSALYLQHRRPMMQWWADYLDTAEKAGLEGKALPAMAITRPRQPQSTVLLPWDD
ncbi:phage integrase central domain-containing protein [Sphingomonas sp. LaA6.9]|uniref:tyrosine-type recombinase/integrase n=1 Tax=Sphingomonas sp. LaA6.9 TaxID=2919914 RepID=UPI001F4FFA7E|nr:integrase arm-type DNA-binding domain-containing protein [Sphingomonas sp. LaA6.9]MCJ8158594.1 integrase arm-type DNA-binding domain-containing protein [Sphingomonas sp. LaA6.9]